MTLDLNDKTSNGNTLTNNGADEVTTNLPFAEKSEAAQFVAANGDYMTADDKDSLSITGDLTIEFWWKPTTVPTSADTNHWLISKWNPTGNQRSYGLVSERNGPSYNDFRFFISTNGTNEVSGYIGYTMSAGTWYHIAITHDGTTAELFIGGTSQGTVGVSGRPYDGTSTLDLANVKEQLWGETGTRGNGIMTEIRFWNDIRTATEINDNKAVELTGSEANLVAYWPFETLTTSAVKDLLSAGIIPFAR